MALRMVTSIELVEWLKTYVIWLQIPKILWLGGGSNTPGYSMKPGLVRLGRGKYKHRYHNYVSEMSLSLSWLLESWNITSQQVLFKYHQNTFKHVVKYFALRFINLLFLFWICKICPVGDKSRPFYLTIIRTIKQTVLSIEVYQICHLRITFYAPSCCEG